jgi:hypothetical protein
MKREIGDIEIEIGYVFGRTEAQTEGENKAVSVWYQVSDRTIYEARYKVQGSFL